MQRADVDDLEVVRPKQSLLRAGVDFLLREVRAYLLAATCAGPKDLDLFHEDSGRAALRHQQRVFIKAEA